MAVNFDLSPWEVVGKGLNKSYTFDRIFNIKKMGLKENFKDFHKMTGKVQSKIF